MIIPFILIFVLFSGSIEANTKATSEEVALLQLAFGMHMFEVNQGRAPTNWGEIKATVNIDGFDERLIDHPGCPLEKFYVFVQQTVLMPADFGEGDRLLKLIAAGPDTRKGFTGLGRYAIYGNSNFCSRIWLYEDQVQKILTRAGATLPEPDPEVVRRAEENLRHYRVKQRKNERDLQESLLRFRIELLKDKVADWFISAPATNTASGPSPQSSTRTLKPISLILTGLVISGFGLLVFRCGLRNRLPDSPRDV